MTTTTTDQTTELHAEQYAGEALTVTRIDHVNRSGSTYYAWSNGKRRGYKWVRDTAELDEADMIAKLLKAARKTVLLVQEDDRLRPELNRLATTNAGTIEPSSTPAKVNDVIRLFSRGATRYGVVVGVTRTGTATAAFTTPGGIAEGQRYSFPARVTRKAAKLGDYEVVEVTR